MTDHTNANELIPVNELWPYEGVVVTEKVENFKKCLANDEDLPPIEFVVLNEKKIIRDGNNRCRAWVEHFGEPVPDIPCKKSEALLTAGSQQEELLLKGAEWCGQGVEAVLKIRKVPAKDYAEAQLQVARLMTLSPGSE